MNGPLLDRIDPQIEVPALTAPELHDSTPREPSRVVQRPIIAARAIQRGRGGLDARLSHAGLREHCAIDAPAPRLVADAVDRGGMSARGVHRALRVARTTANLVGEEHVGATRLAQAIQYWAYEARRFAIGSCGAGG